MLGPEALSEKLGDFKGLFEGDDGICEYTPIDPALMLRLGIKLKIERAPSFEEAGFCTIYCDPGSLTTYRDPKRTLLKFFALPPKFRNSKRSKVLAYLRAKAMSYKYLFPDAPVVGPLMDWVLRRTKSIDCRGAVEDLDYWQKYIHQFIDMDALKTSARPSIASRSNVERIFSVDLVHQMCIEDVLMRSNADVLELDLTPFLNEDYTRLASEFLFHRRSPGRPPVPVYPPLIREVLKNGLSGLKCCVASSRHREFYAGVDRDLTDVP